MDSTNILKPKKLTFKVGDRVKIIVPARIIRVGYPLDKEAVKATLITKEEKDIIARLLGKPSYESGAELNEFKQIWPNYTESTCQKIIDALAYHKLKEQRFGGNTRQIFTNLETQHQGKVCPILKKKVVRTGEYYAPSSSQTYEGEYDYEPGGLENAKCHMLLQLNVFSESDFDMVGKKWGDGFWIESKNVEKVIEDESV